jgi:hypothetical protein
MIECKVEEESKPIDFAIKATETKGKVEVVIPEGYGYIIENDKLYFITKKKEYPKTYEECCKVLGVEGTWHVNSTEWEEYDKLTPYEKKLDYITSRLKQRIICRDAYWKIAGDWKPDWRDMPPKHVLNDDNGTIVKNQFWYGKQILAFPTAKMRDAFYENFKELINECKELL